MRFKVDNIGENPIKFLFPEGVPVGGDNSDNDSGGVSEIFISSGESAIIDKVGYATADVVELTPTDLVDPEQGNG